MSEAFSNFSRLPGVVTDYFVIEAHVVSTRTADAYKALDKVKRQSVALWITRKPLRPDVEEAYASRLQRIVGMPGIVDVSSAGVDSEGSGFIVCSVFDGQQITFGAPESAELERRFLSCLRIVERVHAAGVVCGDLCLESFMMDRGGRVRLVAIVGSFEDADDINFESPTADQLAYMPPEQRSAAAVSPKVDVYALGALAYRLFTGALPQPERDLSVPVSAIAPQVVPSWLDEMLARALNPLPNQRFANANTFLADLNALKTKIAEQSLTPAVVGKPKAARPKESEVVAVQIPMGRPMGGGASEAEGSRKLVPKVKLTIPLRWLGVGAAALGVLALLSAGALLMRPAAEPPRPVSIDPSDIAGLNVSDSNESVQEYISRLGTSDDPLAHHALTTVAKEHSQSPEVVEAARRAVLDRARRLGLSRSSDQLRAWLKGDGLAATAAQVEPFFKLMDPAMPTASRVEILKAQLHTQPRLVLRLTASFVLDLNDLAGFRSVLLPAAADVAQAPDTNERSTLAILLLFTDISSIFLEDILASTDKIADADIVWLMRNLAKQGAPQLPVIADLALSRKMASGSRQIFLQMLRKQANLERPVELALIEGAVGTLSTREIATFGGWYDEQAERVLAACIVVARDQPTRLAALDALSAKSISDPFVAMLIEAAQGRFKADRAVLAKLIGAISLLDVVSPEYLKEAFAGLDKTTHARDIFFMLLKSPSQEVVEEVMTRYAAMLDTLSLIDLLPHENRLVRMAAARNLKDFNDIGMMKLVLDAYEREADPDVRRAYEENVSIVKERLGENR